MTTNKYLFDFASSPGFQIFVDFLREEGISRIDRVG